MFLLYIFIFMCVYNSNNSIVLASVFLHYVRIVRTIKNVIKTVEKLNKTI